jgi:hypothetical protein
MNSFDITDAMVDAAAESLAVIWPSRGSGMCTLGLPIKTRRQIKQAARDALLAAQRWRGVQTREKSFLGAEEEE